MMVTTLFLFAAGAAAAVAPECVAGSVTNEVRRPSFICGEISDSTRYDGLHPNIRTALEFLRKTDLSTLKLGRNEVEGNKVYVNIVEPELKPFTEQGKVEAHRRYADIHVPIIGKETIGVYALTIKEQALPYDEKSDCVLFEAKDRACELQPGKFALFLPPNGGHRPNCTQEKTVPKGYRKAVVKVLID